MPPDKVKKIALGILKGLGFLVCFYFFICALELMTTSFKLLVGTKKIADWLQEANHSYSYPARMMIGVVGTMMVQSSSAFTSVVVAAIATDVVDLKTAIPMIMGANFGTTITNTLVSMAHLRNRNELRLAIAASSIHDFFNWGSMLVFMGLEWFTSRLDANNHGVLQKMVEAMVEIHTTGTTGTTGTEEDRAETIKFIRHLSDPLCHFFVEEAGSWKEVGQISVANTSLFGRTNLSPAEVGGIVLPLSLLLLGLAFFGIVKLLRLLLESSIKDRLMAFINRDFDSPLKKYLHGYLRILIGAGITILLQSSSIFTSTLVPMAGTGIIEVDSIYPLFLGSNLGTTVSTFVAALAVSHYKEEQKAALQAALIHFFFNLFGVLIFYPLPFMRIPIFLGRQLGNTVAQYRWFLGVYIILMYLIFPLFFIVLSLIDSTGILTAVVTVLMVFMFACYMLVSFMRSRGSLRRMLPSFLLNWDFVPIWMRSLAPYDEFFKRNICCRTLEPENEEENHEMQPGV